MKISFKLLGVRHTGYSMLLVAGVQLKYRDKLVTSAI